MLPNPRLLARAFHRVSVQVSTQTGNRASRLSTSSAKAKWEGSKPEDNVARETDSHNIQQDATRSGKAERASGQGSSATTESASSAGSEDLNKKAEKDHAEAPKPVIGMNDERGPVSTTSGDLSVQVWSLADF
jgi:hypothetical protein